MIDSFKRLNKFIDREGVGGAEFGAVIWVSYFVFSQDLPPPLPAPPLLSPFVTREEGRMRDGAAWRLGCGATVGNYATRAVYT